MEHGLSSRAIAAVTGVSPTTICRDLARNDVVLEDGRRSIQVGKVLGLDNKVRPSRRFDTSERDRTIREKRAEGQTIRKIAEEVGCSPGTVHRVLRLEDW